jgi:serine/threonine-protein kinase
MIQLRVLGPISLKREDGSDVAPILAQPKRLALAAYLASPPPHGGRCFHRKDTLVGMFWPELDQQHARAALRNALYFLRESLGADVLVAHGEEEVGLDQDALWCDVDAFDVAFRTRDYSTALNLYGGDLLQGVFVSGAPTFEQWLDTQRVRRQNEAHEAASQAAGRHAAAGRLDEALVWALRAQALAPLHEHGVRTVIALRYLLDDRAGAIEAHNRFETLLSEEHGIEPTQETKNLMEAVHAPEKHAVATTLAMAQMPWVRFAAGPTEAAAGLYDRQVLEAVVQKRLGVSRRCGEKVGLVCVKLDQSQARSAPAGEREVDGALRNLARRIVECVRDADLVALVEPGTLVVVPAGGAVADLNALVARMRAHLANDAVQRKWASLAPPAPIIATAWLDPSTNKSAAALLADAVK